MSELLEKIRSRGYWKVIIRPATFTEKRIAHQSDLLPILEKNLVALKGWNFPHIDNSREPGKGSDWISQEISWGPIVEFWRFYQSGQFVHYYGLPEDWSELPNTRMPSNDGVRRVLLEVKDVLLRFTEIFEFAARLAYSEAGDDGIHLDITVDNIEEHYLNLPRLTPDKATWIPHAAKREIEYTVNLSKLELVTKTRELALKPALDFFRCFNWNPGIDYLRDYQDELLPRSFSALR